MILYAVADVHGKTEYLARIEQTVWERRPDLLVVAGDVVSRRHAAETLEYLDGLSIPVLLVRGNMDPSDLDRRVEPHRNIRSLHRREIVVGGIPFAGVGGTLPVPFRSRISVRERDDLTDLAPRIRTETVLVAHPPPLGTLDRAFGLFPAGSRGLRDLVLRTGPRLLVCGHIHEAAGAARLGETLVVNAAMGRKGNGALIRLGEGDGLHPEWP
jgi:Icc-related predicted phosphoesterase